MYFKASLMHTTSKQLLQVLFADQCITKSSVERILFAESCLPVAQ